MKMWEIINQNCIRHAKNIRVTLDYTTPCIHQLNCIIERIFAIIQRRPLDMLLNTKLNEIDKKLLWADTVYKCERIRNSMDTTGSRNITFEIFFGEKLKIVGSFRIFYRLPTTVKVTELRSRLTTRCTWP